MSNCTYSNVFLEKKSRSLTCWFATKQVTWVATASTTGPKATAKGSLARWSATTVEAITSLEIARPTKVTSHVERSKVRATQKAEARRISCSQSKSDPWSERQWTEDRPWETADSQWQEPQWEPDSKFWETATDSAQPAMSGTLDVHSVLRDTKRDHPITHNTSYAQYKDQSSSTSAR